jgi:outer membrane biosynthesis protein TonB
VVQVAPDLSGIELTGLRGVALAEILIDTRGEVRSVCLLRGVREDVDERAVAAIRQWRLEPTRLRHSTRPGIFVAVVMTVSLAISQ